MDAVLSHVCEGHGRPGLARVVFMVSSHFMICLVIVAGMATRGQFELATFPWRVLAQPQGSSLIGLSLNFSVGFALEDFDVVEEKKLKSRAIRKAACRARTATPGMMEKSRVMRAPFRGPSASPPSTIRLGSGFASGRLRHKVAGTLLAPTASRPRPSMLSWGEL